MIISKYLYGVLVSIYEELLAHREINSAKLLFEKKNIGKGPKNKEYFLLLWGSNNTINKL